MFSEHFSETNFWQMWRTMFAFQNWHSVIELRRYFLRLVQEFPRMHTMSGVLRSAAPYAYTCKLNKNRPRSNSANRTSR
jgi:myosin-crossreactive antigen